MTTHCPAPLAARGGGLLKGYARTEDPGGKLVEIEGLSRVNLFVGPNNAGKSRLLRHLAQAEDVEFSFDLSLIENAE